MKGTKHVEAVFFSSENPFSTAGFARLSHPRTDRRCQASRILSAAPPATSASSALSLPPGALTQLPTNFPSSELACSRIAFLVCFWFVARFCPHGPTLIYLVDTQSFPSLLMT